MTHHVHRVRYHETDTQGFVFNSRYLEFADVAMTEFVRDLGWTYGEFIALGADLSLVHAEIDFRRPARFDDVLDLAVDCVHVGRSSLRLETRFTRDGEEIAVTSITYVNIDPATTSSQPLPEVVVEALRRSMSADGIGRQSPEHRG